jgi:predicted nucleic acid-binding protein
VSAVVVDASVAVKWFLPEVHATAARRILRGRRQLLAPDLIWAEVGNVLWKRTRRAELSREAAHGILRDFRRFPLHTYTAHSLLEPAWELAERLKISVYDGLYLALAVGRSCTFVTADRQLHRALSGTPFASSAAWIERSR